MLKPRLRAPQHAQKQEEGRAYGLLKPNTRPGCRALLPARFIRLSAGILALGVRDCVQARRDNTPCPPYAYGGVALGQGGSSLEEALPRLTHPVGVRPPRLNGLASPSIVCLEPA